MARRNKEEQTLRYDLEVVRATVYKDTVFFDLKVNQVVIYGCRFIEGKNGDFVSFPSHQGKDGKYYNYAYIELNEAEVKLIDELIDKALA